MINPFKAQAQVRQIQHDVLQPLYTMYPGQHDSNHEQLLAETGEAIARHKDFIHAVCSSLLVSIIFNVVKLLGGAEQLTRGDFDRFTSYVNDGGIDAMLAMLESNDKDGTFLKELATLPPRVQQNAPLMLARANGLHGDFIRDYFSKAYGSLDATPVELIHNFEQSTAFIARLTVLAQQFLSSNSQES